MCPYNISGPHYICLSQWHIYILMSWIGHKGHGQCSYQVSQIDAYYFSSQWLEMVYILNVNVTLTFDLLTSKLIDTMFLPSFICFLAQVNEQGIICMYRHRDKLPLFSMLLTLTRYIHVHVEKAVVCNSNFTYQEVKCPVSWKLWF